MVPQLGFYFVCLAAGVGLYSLLVVSIRYGSWLSAAVCAFIASPGMILVLAGTLERRSVLGLLDLDRQSWAVLFGDAVVLPLAAAMAALAWRRLPPSGPSTSIEWVVLWAFIGLMAGTAFHLLETAGYTAAGAGDALEAPTKIWHDFVSYPVLFGALFGTGIPVVFRRRRTWHTWVIVACFVVWVLLVVRDTNHGLDPNWLHPAWDAVNFRPR